MLIQDTERATRKALIHLLGISEAHFHKLKAAGVFQSLDRGVYDLKAAIAAWAKYHSDGRSGSDMAEEKRRLIIAQRKQIELRTRVEERELVPLAEAQTTFNAAMILVGSQLDGLPGRVAGEVAGLEDPAAVRALLFDETRRIRDAAAAKLADWAAGHNGRGAAGSTPTTDG